MFWIVLASKGRKVLLNKSAFHLLVSGSMIADTIGKSSKWCGRGEMTL